MRRRSAGADLRLPVLLYHHVGPYRDGAHRSLTVSQARFERQVRWLARRGFATPSSAEVVDWLRGGRRVPPRALVFTFDDGYADLARFAFPALRRHGFRAIVFLVTGRLGGTNAWDEQDANASHRLLSAEQVREWAACGIEFGAHGREHVDLTRRANVEGEVERSAVDLASVLGTPPRSFAYPFGAVDDASRAAVARHFDLAFTVRAGLNTVETDPHLLRRAMVQPSDTLVDLRLRLQTGESQLDRVRTAVRLRTRARAARRLLGRPLTYR